MHRWAIFCAQIAVLATATGLGAQAPPDGERQGCGPHWHARRGGTAR